VLPGTNGFDAATHLIPRRPPFRWSPSPPPGSAPKVVCFVRSGSTAPSGSHSRRLRSWMS
jgi:hypothetical protein